MIYENSLIASLVKNHIDKDTIKFILSDLSNEIEWDSDLIEIFVENGILDIAFEILDKNIIIELLSSDSLNIKECREKGWIPMNMKLPPNILMDIHNGATIYNIFYNLGYDIDTYGTISGGSYEEDGLCTDILDSEDIAFLGGHEVVINLLNTYGSLNDWYILSGWGTPTKEWYYRNENQVKDYFYIMDIRTVQEFCDSYGLNLDEVLNFLKTKFSENYEPNSRIRDELPVLAVEFNVMRKL